MATQMHRAVLVAQGVRKEYFRKGRNEARHFDAVAGADLTLESGKLAVLLGRSGSGKTTLLNMMAGLLTPTEGAVSLDGQDLYALSDEALSRLRNEKMGVIPQGQTALYNLTVLQNVLLPFSMYRREGSVEQRAWSLLAEMGIEALADSYPRELSGGEMRRMAIARALAAAPEVVLADEPTSDLDDENTQVVLGKLREAADAGAAVLVVTHDTAAERFADIVFHMDGGKLLS